MGIVSPENPNTFCKFFLGDLVGLWGLRDRCLNYGLQYQDRIYNKSTYPILETMKEVQVRRVDTLLIASFLQIPKFFRNFQKILLHLHV